MTDTGAEPARILVAGVGNVLRGDDGFGPAVIDALEAAGGLPSGVQTVETGIGGIGLVHELMAGYDALILVDAVERDEPPGTLCVLEPDVPAMEDVPEDERRILATDLHQAVPVRTLLTAQALDVLPPVVRMVGCQPAETEQFSTELSPVVRPVVPKAIETIRSLVAEMTDDRNRCRDVACAREDSERASVPEHVPTDQTPREAAT